MTKWFLLCCQVLLLLLLLERVRVLEALVACADDLRRLRIYNSVFVTLQRVRLLHQIVQFDHHCFLG